MTTPLPWIPAPNPGGNYRTLILTALQQQIESQSVPGVDTIHRGDPGPTRVEAGARTAGSTSYAVTVCLTLRDDDEGRIATTGPTNRGGKLAHYEIDMITYHFAFGEDDWSDGQDDYYRVVGQLIDCLRGPGRDLGRPDVILQVGEWPKEQNFSTHHQEAVDVGPGTVMRIATTSFTASQYIQQQPA